MILYPFRPPAYEELLARDLYEARRLHLEAARNREYYSAVEAALEKRITRLREQLAEVAQEPSK